MINQETGLRIMELPKGQEMVKVELRDRTVEE